MTASAASMALDEYLSTSYLPDVEYIDGRLREKPVVAPIHGRVQTVLAIWFGQYEEQWRIQTVVEARVKVSENRVRLPDFAVLTEGPLPPKAFSRPHLIAIEVLSDDDRYSDLVKRAQDLEGMGCRTLWLLDPAERAAYRWVDGAWAKTSETRLLLPGSPVFLDLEWLWKKVGQSRQPDFL